MTHWDWLTTKGNVGEIPVEIQPDESAKLVVDTQRDISIKSFITLIDDRVVPGDVCIFKAEVAKTISVQSSISVEIAVHDIEYIKKVDTDQKRVNKMMKTFEKIEKDNQTEEDSDMCSSCNEIDQDTRVTVKDRRGRDLHYCSKCDRLLSTEEYKRWRRVTE